MRAPSLLTGTPGTIVRYGVSLGVLGWLASRLDWGQLRALDGLDWPLVLLAALLAGLAYPLQAWRWQVLLHAQDLALPARWVHRAFWIGQFFNSFLPGGVAGDAVRLGQLWRARPERKAAGAASLVADRLLGLGALFALAAAALALHLGRAGGAAELRWLLAASAAAFVVLLAAGWSGVRTRWWEPVSARVLGRERAAALHDAATALGHRTGALAGATALSVAVWLVDFVSLWVLARGVGFTAGPLEMSVAAAAAYVAAALPISIGGHGVREGALVAVLALLGLGGDTGDAPARLALVFWVLSVAWCLPGGFVYLAGSTDRSVKP